MFDTNREIEIKIPAPECDRHVVVRFPTDEELADRSMKMKIVMRQIGRGKSVTEPLANEKNDLALFAAIKVSGDELDEFEASQVISRLVRCEVTDSRREGNRIVVDLKVPGAKTTHTLRIPSAKQLHKHGRNAISVVDGRGTQEMKLNLQSSGDLYDDLVEKSDGYTAAVPLTHKSAVVSEAIGLLNQDSDESDIEGF